MSLIGTHSGSQDIEGVQRAQEAWRPRGPYSIDNTTEEAINTFYTEDKQIDLLFALADKYMESATALNTEDEVLDHVMFVLIAPTATGVAYHPITTRDVDMMISLNMSVVVDSNMPSDELMRRFVHSRVMEVRATHVVIIAKGVMFHNLGNIPDKDRTVDALGKLASKGGGTEVLNVMVERIDGKRLTLIRKVNEDNTCGPVDYQQEMQTGRNSWWTAPIGGPELNFTTINDTSVKGLWTADE